MKWLCFAFMLIFSIPVLAAGQARFALIIGANLGELGDEPLRYAEEDARKMAHILTRFGSVPEENLLLLQGRSAARVDQAFQAMTERIRLAQREEKETVLVVYYSGHADMAAMHLGRTRLTFARLTELLDGAGATFKILIMDACRSGQLTRVKGARPAQPFQIVSTAKLQSAGNAIITSSAAGEDAQESDRLGGGIFSHHFMSGLRGAADRSGDQNVSLAEAYRYAYDETIRTTSRARFIQHPTYAFKMKGREDLIITRLANSEAQGRMSLTGSGTWVLLNQESPAGGIIEVTTEKPRDMVVPPGQYRVRLRTNDAVYEGLVRVKIGELKHVSTTHLGIIPYGRTLRKGYGLNQQSLYGLSVGSVLMGALTPGVGPNIGATVGVRADFRALSLELRARASVAESQNRDVKLSQRIVGGDITALKIYDPGLLSFGFGLRLGADWLHQSFDTLGSSPDRNNALGRAAPILRIEIPIMARLTVQFSGFVDGVLLQSEGALRLNAVAGSEMGLGVNF